MDWETLRSWGLQSVGVTDREGGGERDEREGGREGGKWVDKCITAVTSHCRRHGNVIWCHRRLISPSRSSSLKLGVFDGSNTEHVTVALPRLLLPPRPVRVCCGRDQWLPRVSCHRLLLAARCPCPANLWMLEARSTETCIVSADDIGQREIPSNPPTDVREFGNFWDTGVTNPPQVCDDVKEATSCRSAWHAYRHQRQCGCGAISLRNTFAQCQSCTSQTATYPTPDLSWTHACTNSHKHGPLYFIPFLSFF